MKRFKILMCIIFLSLSVGMKAQNIELELKNVTVKDAISAVSQQTGYSIVANSDVVDLNKKISVSARNASVPVPMPCPILF